MAKPRPACAIAMYRASRTWGSPENVLFPSGSPPFLACDGAWGFPRGGWDELGGAWDAGVGVGSLADADRNMSCHAGEVADFGSEYGTSSIFDDAAEHAQRRKRERERGVVWFVNLFLCAPILS